MQFTFYLKAHFSNAQFENSRMDGLRKLRPFAYPDILEMESSSSEKKRKRSVNDSTTSTDIQESKKIVIDDSDDDVKPSESGDLFALLLLGLNSNCYL